MDRIIRITLALFLVIVAGTVGYAVYSGYVTESYRSTLTSSYSYSLSITTDQALSNVTLFIPVPADREGNSPVVSALSSHTIRSMPESWQTILFDTGKATLVKIRIPAIIPPPGTTRDNPYTITVSADLPRDPVIDTRDPVARDAVYRPVQNFKAAECSGSGAGTGNPVCGTYETSLYALYTADPSASVTITTSISGQNRWTTFSPLSNEYRAVASATMKGAQKGWTTMKATVSGGIGSFDYPFGLPQPS